MRDYPFINHATLNAHARAERHTPDIRVEEFDFSDPVAQTWERDDRALESAESEFRMILARG